MQVLWHVTMICNILTIKTYNFLGGSLTANLTLYIIKRSSEEVIGNACYSFVSTATLLWTHTLKKSFLFLFFFFFFSHWNLCSTPSVPQQERTLFFSPSLFVSLLTYRSLLVGLQVNGMHTKRKRKGAYKEQEKLKEQKQIGFP